MGNSQKLSVHGFKWVENTSQFRKYFIENFNENSDEGYFFETNVHYLEKLLDIYNDLHFSHESIKIVKVGKHVTNLHDKKEYGVHIRNLKETLNNGLVLKKVHSVIKFNQKAWLKSYIDMNSELKKMQMILKKIFSR